MNLHGIRKTKDFFPYYPQLSLFLDGDKIHANTVLRVENNGIWYLCKHRYYIRLSSDETTEETKSRCIQAIHSQVYTLSITRAVVPSPGDIDTLQISEKDRINRL